MTISIGTKLVAPHGWKAMEQKIPHYFLSSTPLRVLLVRFDCPLARVVKHQSKKRPSKMVTPDPKAILVVLTRRDFEDGTKDYIDIVDAPAFQPPWLDGLEKCDLNRIARSHAARARRQAKPGAGDKEFLTHPEKIDKKLRAIWPLVERADEILAAESPDRILNEHARSLKPLQNEGRVRLWFYLYLLSGRNRQVLHYPTHRIGHWDRKVHPGNVKRGRPAKKGRFAGFNTDPKMKELIVKGFRRHSDLGRTKPEIYVDTLTHQFGCRERRSVVNGQAKSEIFHPEGKPFPRFGAFWYHVEKEFGAKVVAKTLAGEVRVRSQMEPYRGSFTEQTLNFMQRVEADGHALPELPRGLIDGATLRPLYEVVRRDTATGVKTGIGFSQGSETAQAYEDALFCEAVDKEWFSSLWGLKIKADRWPSKGAGAGGIRDRGPGCSSKADGRDQEFRPVLNQLTCVHDGQGKAVVESSHSRQKTNDEVSQFVQSDLRPYELMRRQIYDLVRFNESANVSDRVSLDLINEITLATPNNLHQVLVRRGRTAAVQMRNEEAIRTYLSMRDATLKKGGLYFLGRRFHSDELEHSGACARAVKDISVNIYYLSGCVRSLWLEWEGHLLTVELTLPVPTRQATTYLSLDELEQIAEYSRFRGEELNENRLAVLLGISQAHQESSGFKWNSSKQVPGSPGAGRGLGRTESAEAKADIAGREAA